MRAAGRARNGAGRPQISFAADRDQGTTRDDTDDRPIPQARQVQRAANARRACHAAVPCDGQAGRLDLQSRLHVLLLSEQADAARRSRRREDGRRRARALRARLHPERDRRRSGLFVAGRRADAARPRLLPQGRRAPEQIREGRAADRKRPADQRHAARRGLGPLPEGASLSRGPVHRRPARDPRSLPDHQAGRADVRQGVRRREDAAAVRRAVQHADLRESLQRLAAARCLSLPAPRAGLDLSAVHPDCRDQGLRDDRAAHMGPGAAARGRHAPGASRTIRTRS